MVTVVVEHYQPQGKYVDDFITIGDTKAKTYITGDPNSKVAILHVYDAFGQVPRTIQGADILAESIPALVIMPDFFRGQAPSMDNYPADTPAKKAFLENFRCTVAAIPDSLPHVLSAGRLIKEKYPSVEHVGAIGFCWGGKLLALTSGEDTPFEASIQAHPGRLEKEDAEKITIPHMVLASKHEPKDVVEAYREIFAKKEGRVKELSRFEWWEETFHGWMGSMAKLEDEKMKEAYAIGYDYSCVFFQRVFGLTAR